MANRENRSEDGVNEGRGFGANQEITAPESAQQTAEAVARSQPGSSDTVTRETTHECETVLDFTDRYHDPNNLGVPFKLWWTKQQAEERKRYVPRAQLEREAADKTARRLIDSVGLTGEM